jgi:hypothetical protein
VVDPIETVFRSQLLDTWQTGLLCLHSDFRGEASIWLSSWQQDNQNAAWIFFLDFIKEFIPDLWEMIKVSRRREAREEGVEKRYKSVMNLRRRKDTSTLMGLRGEL